MISLQSRSPCPCSYETRHGGLTIVTLRIDMREFAHLSIPALALSEEHARRWDSIFPLWEFRSIPCSSRRKRPWSTREGRLLAVSERLASNGSTHRHTRHSHSHSHRSCTCELTKALSSITHWNESRDTGESAARALTLVRWGLSKEGFSRRDRGE